MSSLSYIIYYDKLNYSFLFGPFDIYKGDIRRVGSIKKLRAVYNKLFSAVASNLYLLYTRIKSKRF